MPKLMRKYRYTFEEWLKKKKIRKNSVLLGEQFEKVAKFIHTMKMTENDKPNLFGGPDKLQLKKYWRTHALYNTYLKEVPTDLVKA